MVTYTGTSIAITHIILSEKTDEEASKFLQSSPYKDLITLPCTYSFEAFWESRYTGNVNVPKVILPLDPHQINYSILNKYRLLTNVYRATSDVDIYESFVVYGEEVRAINICMGNFIIWSREYTDTDIVEIKPFSFGIPVVAFGFDRIEIEVDCKRLDNIDGIGLVLNTEDRGRIFKEYTNVPFRELFGMAVCS